MGKRDTCNVYRIRYIDHDEPDTPFTAIIVRAVNREDARDRFWEAFEPEDLQGLTIAHIEMVGIR